MQLVGFIATFLVGILGFFLFKLIRIPNPALLGSMFSTGVLSITGYYPSFPAWLVSFLANAAIGVMLGRQVDRNIARRMRELAGYVLFMGAGMIGLSLVSGYALYRMTDIPFSTAMVASSAGGITEMLAFGMSVNADLAVVAFVQLFRVVSFLALISFLPSVAGGGKERRRRTTQSALNRPAQDRFSPRHYPVLIAAALTGGYIAHVLDVPAGSMLGAMIASGACVLALGRVYRFDVRIRYAAQIGLGLVMGQRMTPAVVAQLGELFLPAFITTFVMLLGSVFLAFILHKLSRWDFVTCFLCASPAGLSQITVFAEEIGVDAFTASVFHTVRILGIVIVYPWIILAVL